METLKQMKQNVTFLLERYPKLRDDDWLLIGAVYHNYYGITNESFLDVMKHHKELGLPSFETIRRTRQKVQEERLDLESTSRKKKEKQMSFESFYRFAKEA